MSKKPHISDDKIAAVIERLAEGLNLKESAAIDGFSIKNIYTRINASPELKDLHARAREDYQRTRVDEMHQIARTEPDVQRARLLCDNIKWEAARVLPKVFGDKITSEITGRDGGPVAVSNVTAQVLREIPTERLESILAASSEDAGKN